eukprot:EG_transcript_2799
MQLGFTLVEAGCVKANLRSILMKNVLDAGLCTVAWYFLGHALQRGPTDNSFAGIDLPFQFSSPMISWLWDLSFVCASSAVVSGAVAERVKFMSYCAFILWLSGFVYPFVVHWEWTPVGFLSVSNPDATLPMLDFAGCGAVHLVGGSASLAGAWMVGPRPGAFIAEMPVYTKKEHLIHDRLAATQALFSVMGVMILWVGWYGFNCGSAGGIVGKADVVGLVAVNTTVAAMVGAMFASSVSFFQYRLFKVDVVLMGILSGLVSITGSAPWVRTYMCVPIAVVGFLTYHFLVWLLLKLGIDDPVAAFPIHAGCGFWGLLAAGLFHDPCLSRVASSWGTQLRNQFLGALIIASWSFTLSLIGWFALKLLFHGVRQLDAEGEFRKDVGVQNAKGPSGTVTLLFTDIQSSTLLWEADEEAMELALALHDAVFRTTLQVHRGFEVKTEGDAFMCAFGSVPDAAKFCVAVQHGLMDVKWPKELYSNAAARIDDDAAGRIIWKGLRVRMGFHTGQPTPQENPLTQRTDYLGKDVNYAARVAGVGAGGQILLSSASVRELLPLCEESPSGFDAEAPFGMAPGQRYAVPALECYVEYAGRCPLKGITAHGDGEHVYQLRPYGLESREFPDLAVAQRRRSTMESARLARGYSELPVPTPKSALSRSHGSGHSLRSRATLRVPSWKSSASAISPQTSPIASEDWQPNAAPPKATPSPWV